MKQFIKYSLPVLIAVTGATSYAGTISGSINMTGNVTMDSQDLNTATAVQSISGASVSSGTGDYANVPTLSSTPAGITPVAFLPFTFAPLASQSTPVNSLWSFTANGLNYSFNLLDITSESVSSAGNVDFLMLAGTGTLDISGFDETSGNWSFTITDSSGGKSGTATFGFSDSNTALTPDGGMTVMMLGAALTGLGLIKRKLA